MLRKVLDRWHHRTVWAYLLTLVQVMSWKVGLAMGLMILLGLMEGVGLLLLVPLLQLVGLDAQQGSLGTIHRFVSAVFTFIGVPPTLVTVLITYVLIVSVHGLLHRWQVDVTSALEHEFVAALRQRLYRAIAYTQWLFFVRHRSSELVHALTSEMDRVGMATYYLVRFLATTNVTAVYVGFSIGLSASMTGLALASAGGLWLLLKGKIRISREIGEGISQALRGLYGAIAEHLGGMKVAKSYGAEDRHVMDFARLTQQIQQMYLRAVRNQAGLGYAFEVSSVITLSVLLFLAIEVLALPTAQVLLLLFLFARLMPRFSDMMQSAHSFINAVPSFQSVMEIQRRCEAAAEVFPQQVEVLPFRHSIRLEGVSFRYDSGPPVIQDLHMTIRAGETVALVGPSGAGKSTLADLIMGLLLPNKGRVLVDGVPLGPHTVKAWRAQVGYVSQDNFLFHDTIRANLLFACPDATEEEMHRALKLAAADEFVSKLPQGIDTVVGERGMRLSAGERQRLALARALIRKPTLLILDEATNALDAENEAKILKALQELRGKITILIISHRASTVRSADRIYILDRGRVVEAEAWPSPLA